MRPSVNMRPLGPRWGHESGGHLKWDYTDMYMQGELEVTWGRAMSLFHIHLVLASWSIVLCFRQHSYYVSGVLK